MANQADDAPDTRLLDERIKVALERPGLAILGGGGDDTGMSAWQQSVENRLGQLAEEVRQLRDHMRDDFRWTWGGMIAGLVLLLGVLAKGFGWI